MTWERFIPAYSPLLPAPYWEPALGFRWCPAAQWVTQGGVSKGDGTTLRIGWPREGLCHPGVCGGADKTLLFLTNCVGRVRHGLLGGTRGAAGHRILQEQSHLFSSDLGGVTPVSQTEIPHSSPAVVVMKA